MADEDEIPAIVFDNGSGVCKAGFAGDDEPCVIFPTRVGCPRCTVTMDHSENRDMRPGFVGEETVGRRDLVLSYPMENGIIHNWNDMEIIWHHAFEKLHVSPEGQPLLMTEAPLNPKACTEKTTQIIFEKFNVPAFYLAKQGLLGQYCVGRTSSLLLVCGDGVSHVIPIYEGHTVVDAIRKIDLGGRDLTRYMARLCRARGYCFEGTVADLDIARDIKERLGYVAVDFDLEMGVGDDSVPLKKTYELPDGTAFTVGNERFRVTEPLFQPALIGKHCGGIQDLLYESLMACDIDTRRDLANNLIFAGSTTEFPGFVDRLQKEIDSLIPSTLRARVSKYCYSKYSVWIGGSILASLSTFQQLWITRQEYDETGPSIVHRIS